MCNIEIICKNKDFVVINKPHDMGFHSENSNIGIFSLCQQQLGYELWPVHRLDKLTSGLLIFAKNKLATNQFGKLFEQREIFKTYLAISDKKPKKKQAKIIGDMHKTRNGSWKLTQSKNNPAITQLFSTSLVAGKTLFLIKPTTGKTHQIRVALKSLGSPVLGDIRYSANSADRGYLHAYQISFNWKNEYFNFECLPLKGKYFLLPELKNRISFLTNKHSSLNQ